MPLVLSSFLLVSISYSGVTADISTGQRTRLEAIFNQQIATAERLSSEVLTLRKLSSDLAANSVKAEQTLEQLNSELRRLRARLTSLGISLESEQQSVQQLESQLEDSQAALTRLEGSLSRAATSSEELIQAAKSERFWTAAVAFIIGLVVGGVAVLIAV